MKFKSAEHYYLKRDICTFLQAKKKIPQFKIHNKTLTQENYRAPRALTVL